MFVAIGEDMQLVGFVSVWMAEPFIHHLYINPSHQRFGVGRALLTAVQQWLPLPWQLKCLIKNTAALNFYLSQGWVAVDSGESEDGKFITLQLKRG
ncbi:GNAT family N-acetyltransferase [Iodobacter sp. CM08]|uniref:GNAT family N-acetyltransferase n=1 Tax=Iodobacter sp. CM08 TaxID=3085902 RepID=UPI00298271E1|nr:GNAT family N-acetyltransferase [Iodobacter sp. CM08]MDW5418684.1 GNAT family N-acetyltransferase [Iodobacter sp. CM08]